MFQSFRIAFSLIRIPRLFLFLIFFPLLASFIFVLMQLSVTYAMLRTGTETSLEKRMRIRKQQMNRNPVRKFLYDRDEPFSNIRICRWKIVTNKSGQLEEVPPGPECNPDRLDVALLVRDPATYDPAKYEKVFKGNIPTMHICQSCQPDLVLDLKEAKPVSKVYSVFAYASLMSARYRSDYQQKYFKVMEKAVKKHDQKKLLGKTFYFPKGTPEGIKLSDFVKQSMIPLNVAALLLVALWLSLKAHRKILDYFAKNGALSPLVAASGTRTFYSAIWILTVLRVIAFLGGAVPVVWYKLRNMVEDDAVHYLLKDPWSVITWLIALSTCLFLATLVASIAELKQRSHLLSFIYKFVPFILAIVGSVALGMSYVMDGEIALIIRNIIAAVPVVGMLPVMMAPLIKVNNAFLIVNAVFSITFIVLLLRVNSRWFAAHLEEI